jgi:hypothetical protein
VLSDVPFEFFHDVYRNSGSFLNGVSGGRLHASERTLQPFDPFIAPHELGLAADAVRDVVPYHWIDGAAHGHSLQGFIVYLFAHGPLVVKRP